MSNPTNTEIVPGLLLRSTTHGEVMVLRAPHKTLVRVEAWAWDGQPYTADVRKSSLRWQ